MASRKFTAAAAAAATMRMRTVWSRRVPDGAIDVNHVSNGASTCGTVAASLLPSF